MIVWDFMRYAREQSIPVGPGQGLGGGDRWLPMRWRSLMSIRYRMNFCSRGF